MRVRDGGRSECESEGQRWWKEYVRVGVIPSCAHLHVSNGLYLCVALGSLLVVVHQLLDIGANLPKIEVHILQERNESRG